MGRVLNGIKFIVSRLAVLSEKSLFLHFTVPEFNLEYLGRESWAKSCGIS